MGVAPCYFSDYCGLDFSVVKEVPWVCLVGRYKLGLRGWGGESGFIA